MTDTTIISQTEAWIISVVIGCNFCPFAVKAMRNRSIRYVVLQEAVKENALTALIDEIEWLNTHDDIETTLVILPGSFVDFSNYLDLVRSAEKTVAKQGYEGVYQVASFHPDYLFAGSNNDDPANYTNRSPYPMLHILREASVSYAVDHYAEADNIPDNNIAKAHQKGLRHMQLLLAACFREF